MDWDRAEEICQKQKGSGQILARSSTIPYLLTWRDDEQDHLCLVHRGEVVQDKGLEALGRYLKDINFLAAKEVDSYDFLHLLHAMDALPSDPEGGHLDGGSYRVNYSVEPPIEPTLTMEGHRATMVIEYDQKAPAPLPEGLNIGGIAQPGPARKSWKKWTLVIPRNYKLSYQSEIIQP